MHSIAPIIQHASPVYRESKAVQQGKCTATSPSSTRKCAQQHNIQGLHYAHSSAASRARVFTTTMSLLCFLRPSEAASKQQVPTQPTSPPLRYHDRLIRKKSLRKRKKTAHVRGPLLLRAPSPHPQPVLRFHMPAGSWHVQLRNVEKRTHTHTCVCQANPTLSCLVSGKYSRRNKNPKTVQDVKRCHCSPVLLPQDP